uniref:Uncharacterized protein n=1 Tax=Arundo donax TaxID=35708 RepID=A0A0A9DLB8_ARUDO
MKSLFIQEITSSIHPGTSSDALRSQDLTSLGQVLCQRTRTPHWSVPQDSVHQTSYKISINQHQRDILNS